jgi:hypothetical protein
MKWKNLHSSKLYWFLLTLFMVFLYQWLEINLAGIGWLHETADDASYFNDTFVPFFGSESDFIGASKGISRPPLMSFFRNVVFIICGNQYSLFWFLFCAMLHALSARFLVDILESLKVKRKEFYLYIFAVVPVFSGFVAYQISECLVPFLLLFTFHHYLKTEKNTSGFLFALLLLYLLRPVLLIFFLPLLLHKLKNVGWKKFVGPMLAVFVLTVGLWEVRKMTKMDKLWNPHPIYHETNASQFRPPHKELTDLFRCWEVKSENFHFWMEKCWTGDYALMPSDSIANYLQRNGIAVQSKAIHLMLLEYTLSCAEVQDLMQEQAELSLQKKEEQVMNLAKTKTWEIKRDYPIKVFLQTPIESLVHLVSKSQLNLSVFQDQLRGKWALEAFRILTFVLLLSIYSSVLFSLFVKNKLLKNLAIGISLYLFYLCFFQVLNEDRYMLPIIILGLVLLPQLVEKMGLVFFRKAQA